MRNKKTISFFVILMFIYTMMVPVSYSANEIQTRDNSTGAYILELEGKVVGTVSSVEGGYAVADVVTEQLGPDHIQRKHIGNVKYEDITVTMNIGSGMSIELLQWVKDMIERKATRKNGAVVAADFNYKELSRLSFTNAIITEVTFPALDAASKDAAKMTLKFKPEYTRYLFGTGARIDTKAITVKQKQWLPANFRLKIDGLDQATSRVNKIDSITIKQKVIENSVGEMRDYEKEPVALEMPNLVISIPEVLGQEFFKWHEDFVIKGNNTDDKEKGGTLEFLADAKVGKSFMVLQFNNVGIFKLSPDKMEAGSEGIRRIKAEMYCEDIRFSYTSSDLFN